MRLTGKLSLLSISFPLCQGLVLWLRTAPLSRILRVETDTGRRTREDSRKHISKFWSKTCSFFLSVICLFGTLDTHSQRFFRLQSDCERTDHSPICFLWNAEMNSGLNFLLRIQSRLSTFDIWNIYWIEESIDWDCGETQLDAHDENCWWASLWRWEREGEEERKKKRKSRLRTCLHEKADVSREQRGTHAEESKNESRVNWSWRNF